MSNLVDFERSSVVPILDRLRVLDEISESIAQLWYRGQAIYLGGMLLPWDVLTDHQRAQYIAMSREFITRRGEVE